ncbi:glutamate--tRNA ligase [Candidatus Bathyarchaeota archaeon]|nr:glutamate--tRNA ligase [Candidatus Bathyarchaeota archaeon]
MKEITHIIRKYAVLNAVQHGGKAQVAPVTGKVLAERPELKLRIKELTPMVAEIVREINVLPTAEQRRILDENWPELLVEEKVKPEEKVLPPLPNVDKYEKVITRFSPNPDCVLHLGSARAIILSHDYARLNKGKFYLRFEDTDPRLKKSALEFYDLIREDLIWLGCKWDAEFIQSDRIPIYYEFAEKLLSAGQAYVCTCKVEDFRRKIRASRACPCRGLPPEEHLFRWEKMLNGVFGEGEAVVRVKTDLLHPNPAVRDWPALRIIDTKRFKHPRVGDRYRVWPLYNFACGLDDHLLGITHIIRGKEHLTNEVRQRYLYEYFKWTYPEAIHYGRLKIMGAVLSKSKLLKDFREKVYTSWDDPRLATFAALRRRGITPEAIRRMVIEVGPKPVDATLSWENIYAYNKKIVDPIANRYFFVANPLPLIVNNVAKPYTSTPSLHPNHPERGERILRVKPKNGQATLLISSSDLKILKLNAVVRLIELFNVEITEVRESCIKSAFHSESYSDAKKLDAPLIHWVPSEENVGVRVIMPTAEVVSGVGELDLSKVQSGAIIQLERFGFGRVNSVINNQVTVYFAHK